MSKKHVQLLRTQHGFSILEHAMVLPVLLLIIAGAVDITTLMQGYSAIQEGVQTSLRCVYTVDGKCVQSSPDTRPRLYNYYLVNRQQEYLVDLFNLSGTASWIDRPTYNYSNFTATVLDTVEFDQPTANLSVVRNYYPAQRTANYTVRAATAPYVTGDPRSPTLSFRGNVLPTPAPSGTYPVTSTVSLSGVTLLSDGANGNPDVLTGAFAFTTPPEPVGPVFASQNQEQSLSQPHLPRWNGEITANTISIALHITGTKAGTSVGSVGAVELDLFRRLPDGSWHHVKNLGGQQLGKAPGEDNGANFVIRGVPSTHIGDVSPSYSELSSYPMDLRYNTRYRVQFRLHHTSGTVGWEGGQARIYSPLHIPHTNEAVHCSNALTPCAAPEACVTDAPAHILAPGIAINTAAAPVQNDPPVSIANCSTGLQPLQQLLAQQNMTFCPGEFSVQADSGSCAPQVLQQACPVISASNGGAPNFGVPEIPGGDGKIHGSAAASSICPPPLNSLAGPAQSPRWTVQTAAVPLQHVVPGGNGSFDYSKSSCSDTVQWPVGSMLANYPHLSYTETRSGSVPLYTGTQSPAALLADPNSAYHCQDFSLGQLVVDVTPVNRTPQNQNSLFFGEHVLPGCGWEQALHQEALQYQLMPAQAYFAANTPQASGGKLRQIAVPDVCVDPNPEIVWSDPLGQTLVPGGPYVEGVIPTTCQTSGSSCAAEFAGFGAGQNATTNYDFTYASQHFGFSEVQAQYPRARWNCNDADCVQLTLEQQGEFVQAQGRIKVPLYTLGRGTVELTYRSRERSEAVFAR